MRVLLTGNKGYIGSVVEERLNYLGHKVIGCDLQDVDSMDIRYIQNIEADAIIHLAGMSSDPMSEMDPRLTDLINHRATERLAKLAKYQGVKRFIFASTCSVYFTWQSNQNLTEMTEEDKINPVSIYAISKRQAGMSILELNRHQFEPVIFRFGTVYGASSNMRTDTVVNHFVKDAKYKKRISIFASGNIWRPLVDIQDVAWALVKALEQPNIGGEIFNVLNDNWEIKELANAVAKFLPEKTEIDILEAGIARNYKADNSKFKKIFNWRRQRKFEDAIKELWEKL